jgi:N-acetylglutamate synthase-like GNAT family acetyltransferase
MRYLIRTLKEEELGMVAELLVKQSGEAKETVEKELVVQFHRQGELVIGAFTTNLKFEIRNLKLNELVGVVVATGRGDMVEIKRVAIEEKEGSGELYKRLVVAEEKAARHYGYAKIYIGRVVRPREFYINLGYKPQLLFTFSGISDKRKEIFMLLSDLYPLWINAGGEKVSALLGGDVLNEDQKTKLESLPIDVVVLYFKNL